MIIEELYELVKKLKDKQPGLEIAVQRETIDRTETWIAECSVLLQHPIDPLTGEKEDGPNRRRNMLVFYPCGW